MEISKPLMSPTYLNGVSEERRPESPRSPTKTSIPITPGLVVPSSTPYSYTTPSPEPQSTNSSTLSVNTTSYVYTPTSATAYASPITPRREDMEQSSTPRKRSNSSTRRIKSPQL